MLQEEGDRSADLVRRLKHLKHLEAQERLNAPAGIPVEVANANRLAAMALEEEQAEEEEEDQSEPSTSQGTQKKK
jgi:hypothetical protein